MTELIFDVLDRVASEDKIEKGAWVHLFSPGTASPLYRDSNLDDPKEPVEVRVRSIRSRTYQAHDASEQRRAFNLQKQAKGKALDELIAKAVQDRRARDFSVLVTGFRNVSTSQEGIVIPTEEELLEIGKRPGIGWMIDQVFAAARDDARYGADLGNADAAEPSGRRKSPKSENDF